MNRSTSSLRKRYVWLVNLDTAILLSFMRRAKLRRDMLRISHTSPGVRTGLIVSVILESGLYRSLSGLAVRVSSVRVKTRVRYAEQVT